MTASDAQPGSNQHPALSTLAFAFPHVPHPRPFGVRGYWMAGTQSIGRTIDGTHWMVTPIDATGVERIAPVDDTTAWIVARNSGEGAMPEWLALNRTTDGGAHVTDVSPPGMIGARAFFGHADAKVAFVASTQGLGTKLTLQSTRDAGATWTSVDFACGPIVAADFTSIDALHAFVMVASLHGAASNRGDMFATSDGGVHWRRMPTPPNFGELWFRDLDEGWLLAPPLPSAASLAWHTTDGGVTWKRLELTPPMTTVTDVLALPEHEGAGEAVFPVSPDAFYETTARGASLHGAAPTALDVTHLAFRGREIWLADDTDAHVLHRSRDSGGTWSKEWIDTFTTQRVAVDRIEVASPTRGYVVFGHGDVYRISDTNDGGKTWNAVPGFEEP